MINVRIKKDKDNSILQFEIKGHAGFAEEGLDIVCSAVSAVAYTAVGALKELANCGDYVEEDGYMKCSVSTSIDEKNKYTAQIILKAMEVGLKQIENAYGDYVVVLNEEV